jgi:hypothetical protein
MITKHTHHRVLVFMSALLQTLIIYVLFPSTCPEEPCDCPLPTLAPDLVSIPDLSDLTPPYPLHRQMV